jgi:hypothetical protein
VARVTFVSLAMSTVVPGGHGPAGAPRHCEARTGHGDAALGGPRRYGNTPVMGPADTFTCANGEPMIVGPITLLICPI